MTDPKDESVGPGVTAASIRVHPEQLGVQDFGGYTLVIDARSPHEYADDHIPNAINLPVVDDAEFAEVGITYAKDPHAAYLIGAEHSLRNIAKHVRTHISQYSSQGRFLVYCFRGGKRSKVWADVLRTIGCETDVLPGGWKRYRGWVRESLDSLPRQFTFRVLSGPTGCGKTRLLHALDAIGEQVLDLEDLASHRGSLIGEIPDKPQPPQKLFESLLLDKLRTFDRARPVWIEAESKRIGKIQISDALYEAMRASQVIDVMAEMPHRVRLLREDYAHWTTHPLQMVDRLASLKPLVGAEELALWTLLAERGDVDTLFERLMVRHYDPSYARSRKRSYGQQVIGHVELPSLDAEQLQISASELSQRFGTSATPQDAAPA